jgi:hypothetical protein
MNSRSPRQLGLFSDGVRAVAETGGAKPPLTEADLQVGSKPRMRLHEMLIIRIWLPKETLKQWISSRSNFFVHVKVLARLFRGKFLASGKALPTPCARARGGALHSRRFAIQLGKVIRQVRPAYAIVEDVDACRARCHQFPSSVGRLDCGGEPPLDGMALERPMNDKAHSNGPRCSGQVRRPLVTF